MPNLELARLRLAAQGIGSAKNRTIAETVRWMGAMQAQDFPASLWAIGLRTQDATLADVERAIGRREIVRSWPMRGTLHFVAPEDLRWMLELCAPRVIARTGARDRGLELDDSVFRASGKVIEAALQREETLTRPGIYAVLDAAGISPAGQRGIHIIGRLAQQGLICFGPHVGKQPAFVLLEEWIPPAKKLTRDEALAVLTHRYFESHGPATVNDFAWWSNLTVAEAKQGLEAVKTSLESMQVDGKEYWLAAQPGSPSDPDDVHLLPGFDEFILGYQDRSAVLAPEYAKSIVPGNNGMFMATIVSAQGEVLGTWRKQTTKSGVGVTPEPFRTLSAKDERAFRAAVAGYAWFLGAELS